jgi:gluconokinase
MPPYKSELPLPDVQLTHKPPLRIVVMGVSGAGKSTVGAALAESLGILFRDGDDLHSEANVAKMRAGIALTDEDRWSWLELVANSLRRDAPVVIACSALKTCYRDLIRAGAGGDVTFVHLTGPRDLIAARLAQRNHIYMPADLLDSQLADLMPPSADEALIVPMTLPVVAQVAAIVAAVVA